MKQSKPKQAILVMGLYLVSLMLFLVSPYFMTSPVLVFSLSLQPLNVTTTATIEDDVLFFSELNQMIELPVFPQGEYRLEMALTGGVVVEALTDSGLSPITLSVTEQTMGIEIDDLMGTYQILWRQNNVSSVTLAMTNFVKISSSLFYGVYIQSIQVFKM
jgi:hypothetical protein